RARVVDDRRHQASAEPETARLPLDEKEAQLRGGAREPLHRHRAEEAPRALGDEDAVARRGVVLHEAGERLDDVPLEERGIAELGGVDLGGAGDDAADVAGAGVADLRRLVPGAEERAQPVEQTGDGAGRLGPQPVVDAPVGALAQAGQGRAPPPREVHPPGAGGARLGALGRQPLGGEPRHDPGDVAEVEAEPLRQRGHRAPAGRAELVQAARLAQGEAGFEVVGAEEPARARELAAERAHQTGGGRRAGHGIRMTDLRALSKPLVIAARAPGRAAPPAAPAQRCPPAASARSIARTAARASLAAIAPMWPTRKYLAFASGCRPPAMATPSARARPTSDASTPSG